MRKHQAARSAGWDPALIRGGIAVVVLLAVAAVVLRDREAAAFAVGGLAGLALLRLRSGLLGRLGLGLLGADVAFWMGAGAVSNLTHSEGFWETALPASLTIAGSTTLAAALGAVVARRRNAAAANGPRVLQGLALVATVAVVLVSAVGSGGGTRAVVGDIEVVTEDVKFSETDITAEAGEVGIVVANRDLFWHTFTIKKLDLNVTVPVGAERRTTFSAQPGTYEFICAIPGHTQAGMKGTLSVR